METKHMRKLPLFLVFLMCFCIIFSLLPNCVYATTDNFGEEGIGDGSQYVSPDYKYVSAFTCDGNGIITKLTVRFVAGGGGANVKAVIYTNNVGEPNALYATGDETY